MRSGHSCFLHALVESASGIEEPGRQQGLTHGCTVNHSPSIAALSDLRFDHADIERRLDALSSDGLDALDFGVIGFDGDTIVTAYNAFESEAAGLRKESVMGRLLFVEVAPCMNNFMVAQRFEDAAAQGTALDAAVDYVLTLRMRPVKVVLRLVATPTSGTRYVLVSRSA